MQVAINNSSVNIDEFLENWKNKHIETTIQELDDDIAKIKPLLEEYYNGIGDTREISRKYCKGELWFYGKLREFGLPLRPVHNKIIKRAKELAMTKTGDRYLCEHEDCWICAKVRKEVAKTKS